MVSEQSTLRPEFTENVRRWLFAMDQEVEVAELMAANLAAVQSRYCDGLRLHYKNMEKLVKKMKTIMLHITPEPPPSDLVRTPWWISDLSTLTDEVRDRTILVKINSQLHSWSNLEIGYLFSEIGKVDEVKYLPTESGFHSQVRFQNIYDSEWAYYYYNGRFVHHGCCEIELHRPEDVISWNNQRIGEVLFGIRDTLTMTNTACLVKESLIEGEMLNQTDESTQILTRKEPNLVKESSDYTAYQVLDEMPKSIVDELDFKFTHESLAEELNDMKDFEVSDLNHVTSLSLVENVAADLVRFLHKSPNQEEIMMDYIGLLCFDPGGRDLLVTDSLKFELPLQEKCGLWCIDELLPEMTNAFQISLLGVPVHNHFNLECDQGKENARWQNLVLEPSPFDSIACLEILCFDPGGEETLYTFDSLDWCYADMKLRAVAAELLGLKKRIAKVLYVQFELLGVLDDQLLVFVDNNEVVQYMGFVPYLLEFLLCDYAAGLATFYYGYPSYSSPRGLESCYTHEYIHIFQSGDIGVPLSKDLDPVVLACLKQFLKENKLKKIALRVSDVSLSKEEKLRGSVFEAIEDEDRVVEKGEGLPPALLGSCNDRAKQLHASPSARLLAALVCEYMDWAQLNHTHKVYLPECNPPKDFWKAELEEFNSKNGLDLSRNGESGPLLLDVPEGFLKFESFPQARDAIDLLNVSFEGDSAPNRITGRAGLKELKRIAPQRSWRLVNVDADLSNLSMEMKHVMPLINPAKTYMDLNICLALWLAAGGDGVVYENGDNSSKCAMYKSEARILLVGSGADEQCAGYGRHRTKYIIFIFDPGKVWYLQSAIMGSFARFVSHPDKKYSMLTDKAQSEGLMEIMQSILFFLVLQLCSLHDSSLKLLILEDKDHLKEGVLLQENGLAVVF